MHFPGLFRPVEPFYVAKLGGLGLKKLGFYAQIIGLNLEKPELTRLCICCSCFLFVLCILMTLLAISKNQKHFATAEISYIVNNLSTNENFTEADKPGRNQQISFDIIMHACMYFYSFFFFYFCIIML